MPVSLRGLFLSFLHLSFFSFIFSLLISHSLLQTLFFVSFGAPRATGFISVTLHQTNCTKFSGDLRPTENVCLPVRAEAVEPAALPAKERLLGRVPDCA